MNGESTLERVSKIASWGTAKVGECLGRARGGDLEALADFVTHALIKKHVDAGYTGEQAVFATKALVDAVEIKVRLS